MTGYDIYKKVCSHLGYDSVGETNQGLTQRVEEFLLQIGYDLRLNLTKGLSQELNLSPAEAEALIYGVAMMTAVSENDGGHALMFSQLYNAKRAKVLNCSEKREDILPNLDMGGM